MLKPAKSVAFILIVLLAAPAVVANVVVSGPGNLHAGLEVEPGGVAARAGLEVEPGGVTARAGLEVEPGGVSAQAGFEGEPGGVATRAAQTGL